ncbi:hypothetical protein SpCBS45565_g02293 [Spizellomyces sp. 'palustris']|nr:hypothetical protein SpCBS45565_g02293 [Spizellomyces sp. 'palustris']
MPTGVTVSQKGRIFVNYPYWSDDIIFTVAELKDGREVPFPSSVVNWKVGPSSWNQSHQAEYFVSVQAVVIDPHDNLWILDTGRPVVNGTMLDATYGGPKLVCVDLKNDTIIKTIVFPMNDTIFPKSYLNDVRFDLRILTEGVAYITDSSDEGYTGIVVVDLDSGESWRRLHMHSSTRPTPRFVPSVAGLPIRLQPEPSKPPGYITTGSDGITLSADGLRLFYCPLASRRLFSIDARIMAAPNANDNNTILTVTAHGEKGGTSDGLESDDQGNIYISNQDQNAIFRGRYQNNTLIIEPFVRDPRIQWADTLSVGFDHRLYFTSNQLHLQAKYWGGRDLRKPPYALYSVPLEHNVGRVNLTCVSTGLVECTGSMRQRQCRC